MSYIAFFFRGSNLQQHLCIFIAQLLDCDKWVHGLFWKIIGTLYKLSMSRLS